MTTQLITKEEAQVLRDALIERGELTFPLKAAVSSFLCGTIYGLKKKSKPFEPKLKHRIVARISDGYASVLAFALWIGPENVDVWDEFVFEGGKVKKNHFHMKLKPNKVLKCAPSGPDAASLRRLT